jgi:hypothetical protein
LVYYFSWSGLFYERHDAGTISSPLEKNGLPVAVIAIAHKLAKEQGIIKVKEKNTFFKFIMRISY